jgi:hypothetical protein
VNGGWVVAAGTTSAESASWAGAAKIAIVAAKWKIAGNRISSLLSNPDQRCEGEGLNR